MFKGIFNSRKFWALIAGLAAIVASVLSGEIAWAQAINLIVAAISVFIGATAVEDAGRSK